MKVDAGSCLKEMNVKIELSGINKLRFKIWFGSLFIRLGFIIIGCDVEWRLNND